MPAYRTTLADDALKTLLEDGPIRVASLDDLAHLAGRLEALDEWVHTMEVNEIRGAKSVGRLDLSIMGLDGEDDWEIPLEPARMRALLAEKIAAMRATGANFSVELWMGEAAD
jgi:hypothetical protein